MATSWGEAAARGIETGFGIGLRYDQQEQQNRSNAVQEARQVSADKRAEEETRIRRDTETRQERRLADAERQSATTRATGVLESRRKDLLAAGTNVTATGAPVPAGMQEEYAQVSSRLAALRQQALDDASRLATGQLSMESMTPDQLYRTVTLGTGMPAKDLQAMPKYAADLQAGMETGNQGLVLQAVNGIMAPQLRIGVGSPSPYGGTITRKEIIGLDPARDANGVDHPGRVIPRMRVYVQRPGDTQERYYDAPMTMDRSSDPDDKAAAIDIQKVMDWVGNLGVLTTVLQRPEMQTRLAEGEQKAGPEVQKYFDEFNLAIKPGGKKQITREKTDLGDRWKIDEVDSTGKVINTTYEPKRAAPSSAGQAAGADLKQRLSLLEDDYIDGLVDDNEYKRRRADLISGIKSRPKDAGGADEASFSDKYQADEKYRAQVDFWAKTITAGGQLPPRFAQSGAGKAMFQDIIQRVPELGGDPREMLANQSELGGAKAGARTLGTRSANFALAKSEAYEMADLVSQASEKVGRTDFMPINRAIIAFERNTGDPEAVQFGAALNSFIQAYARAVSPVGQPTVHDKTHAREMLETAQSHEQVQAVIEQLKAEMEAAGRAVGTVRGQQRTAITGGLGLGAAAGAPPPAAAPAAAPAPARKAPPAVGTVMRGYRFKGGDPAVQTNWEKVQ